jgi:hypothetical protein
MMPIVDEFRPGGWANLQRMYEFFSTQTPYNPRKAARTFEHVFVAPFTPGFQLEWGAASPVPAHEPIVRAAVQIQALSLILAAVYAWRRRRLFEASLATILIVSGAAGLWIVRRLPEDVHDYTVHWVAILGVLSWAIVLASPASAVASVVVREHPDMGRRISEWAPRVLAGAIVAACFWQVAERTRRDWSNSQRTYELTRIIQAEAGRAAEPFPFIRVPPDFWGVSTGVVLQLYREGRPHVDAERVSMFGRPLAPTGRERLTIQFAQWAEHMDDFRHRSDYRRLGDAGGIFVYAAEPAPNTDVLTPPALVDTAPSLADANRLIDVRWMPNQDDNPMADAVLFSHSTEFVTVLMPSRSVIGVRLWGGPDTRWQLRCSPDHDQFERIGQVRTRGGPATQSGDAYLAGLSGCSRLKVAPVSDYGRAWLTEIQLLAAK